MTILSVLDLSPIATGSNAGEALRNTVQLAMLAERLGYRRYWLAEHHNMPSCASAATAVLVGHVAANTGSIRVGAGGIMLPNHAPLMVAEQFGTLALLFPGRIDLGLGRYAGTDVALAAALRRGINAGSELFARDVVELMAFFASADQGQAVQAVPGAGTEPALWMLGSSENGARLAARLGLPFAFAAHFHPVRLALALQVYRDEFLPSARLERPYVVACINIIATDRHDDARRLFTSHQLLSLAAFRKNAMPLPAPVDDMAPLWSVAEKTEIDAWLACSLIGDAQAVKQGLDDFVARTGVDEVIVNTQVFDHALRMRSFEIVAGIARG